MPSEDTRTARILMVDDQEANVLLLKRILKGAGYNNLASTQDPREAAKLYREYHPDLVLLDLHMPHLSGFTVMEQLGSSTAQDDYVPILVLTADILPEVKQKALSAGAKDFLTKPFDVTEVLLRIRNMLETRWLYRQLQGQNHTLEDRIRERTSELESAQIEMLQRLALASESRDDDTGRHTQRVGRLAAILGGHAGLPEERIALLEKAATLHDIGKIGIPDNILLKPGKLTSEEFEQMKTHAELGARILSGSHFSIIQLAEEIAHYHHERWDGSGYYSLQGEAIPLSARIVSIADVFDVLTHARPYKPAWPPEKALAEIERQSGRHFDPHLVKLFLQDEWPADLCRLGEAVFESSQAEAQTLEGELSPTAIEGLVFRR
ncbi:MAG: response regulator [Acidobacteria bacterium]|nr:response regulator [Acidobacteriota bacterium]